MYVIVAPYQYRNSAQYKDMSYLKKYVKSKKIYLELQNDQMGGMNTTDPNTEMNNDTELDKLIKNQKMVEELEQELEILEMEFKNKLAILETEYENKKKQLKNKLKKLLMENMVRDSKNKT